MEIRAGLNGSKQLTYCHVTSCPIVIPQDSGIEWVNQKVCFFMCSTACAEVTRHLKTRCSMEVLMMEMVSTSDTSLEQFLTTKLVLDSQWYKAQACILLYRNDHRDILQPWALSFQPWGDGKFELGRCGKAGVRTFDIVVSSTAVCLLWHKLRCRNQRDHQEVLTFRNGKEHDTKQSISMCSASNIGKVTRRHVHWMIFLMPCHNRDCCLVTPCNDRHKHCPMSRRVSSYQILSRNNR